MSERSFRRLAVIGADQIVVGEDNGLSLYQPDSYTAAIVKQAQSGAYSAVLMAAKDRGKATKVSTRARISQTWFASQMGPMARAMARRCRRRW